MQADEEKICSIFFPLTKERQAQVKAQGTRFVHYTTAEAAVQILRSKTIWMRPSYCMNDFMEVEHGWKCLCSAYNNNEIAFKSVLDGVFDGTSQEIEKLFNAWIPQFKLETYLSCFSEHQDSEDVHGRLSMWRAYGKTAGVALVFSSTPFLTPSHALKAYASPVAYLSEKDFETEFARVMKAVKANTELLRAQGRQSLLNWVFHMFRFAVLCTKHPGFAEEREWRVVYCPAFELSDLIAKDVQVIAGTPQPIYKIPLKDIPDKGLTGIEIPALLDQIIIGPSNYPLAMLNAFCSLLQEAGIPNPDAKIFPSNIPLRT